jgi:hypothetical protein
MKTKGNLVMMIGFRQLTRRIMGIECYELAGLPIRVSHVLQQKPITLFFA